MKHYSPTALARRAAVWPPLVSADDLLAELRASVLERGRVRLARALEVSPVKLAGVLRGRWPVDAEIAAALGYRAVVRFERIE